MSSKIKYLFSNIDKTCFEKDFFIMKFEYILKFICTMFQIDVFCSNATRVISDAVVVERATVFGQRVVDFGCVVRAQVLDERGQLVACPFFPLLKQHFKSLHEETIYFCLFLYAIIY